MNDTKERLMNALALMEEKGWVKGWFGNAMSGYCLRGALGDGVLNPKAVPMECYAKIDAALVELGFGSRRFGGDQYYPYETEDDRKRDEISFFNNHDATTFDDIRNVFRRAIELA